MKNKNWLLALLPSVIFAASQTAVASNQSGAVTITPSVGYVFLAHKRHLNNTAVLPEIAVAYNLDKHWALEGTYAAFNTSRHPSGSMKGNLYMIDGLYRFANYGRLEPYVAAGLGVLYLNQSSNEAANQANLNAGLGAQIFFSESVALRSEVRDLYTMSGGKNDVLLNLGVSFLMDNHD